MSETKVVTGKVRLSYVNIFKPKAVNEGDEPKYSLSIIIPKKNKKLISSIEEAVKAAAIAGKSSKFDGKIPKNLKSPLRDGDEDREDDENYENSMFINCNSTRKPGVVDKDLQEIIDPEEVYSGCYGRVDINFYAYNVSGNKGIACGLNNVQKLEDGDNLGGGGNSAAEAFGSEDDDLMG